jgi:hypothetical protein
MLLNAYLICLRFTQGSTIKRTVQVGRLVSGRVQSGGVAPDGNIPLPLMTKGERFIRCKGKCLEKEHRHGSRGSDGHRGSMSDMNSVFHIASDCFHQFQRGRLLINWVGCH